jgi:signal transduction histidine kinase
VELDVVTSGASEAIPRAAASSLYRVAQVALRNAVRHGSPRAVRVTLSADATAARLRIADDGRGFDVQEAESRRPGMGLFSMRERIALVNGTLAITSAPGQGTVIEATVPLTDTDGQHHE